MGPTPVFNVTDQEFVGFLDNFLDAWIIQVDLDQV